MNLILWNKYHCFALFGTCILFLADNSLVPFLVISLFSIIVLWKINWPVIKNLNPYGGFANHLTLLRYLIALCIGFLHPQITNLQIFSGLLIFIMLDGVDGYVARKKNQRSEFGAFFDQETDAIYICVISCILLLHGLTGYWILIPGFIRYFYAVLVDLTKHQNKNDKRTRFGPAITVIMFLALALAFILPVEIRTTVLLFSSTLLVGSFAYSYYLLLKY